MALFQFPSSKLFFMQLLDLATMDIGSLQFSSHVLAASAISLVLSQAETIFRSGIV